jgi:hypothetical protein
MNVLYLKATTVFFSRYEKEATDSARKDETDTMNMAEEKAESRHMSPRSTADDIQTDIWTW